MPRAVRRVFGLRQEKLDLLKTKVDGLDPKMRLGSIVSGQSGPCIQVERDLPRILP
jgi:hypothetical protein